MSEQDKQDTFVRWQEAAEILGLKRGAFFYYVENGQIGVEPGRGKRGNRYSMQDILKVKRQKETKKPRRPYRLKPRPAQFDWVQASDIPACLDLDYRVFDEALIADARIYQEWVSKNPFIAFAAYDGKNRHECLAYISILPLSEEMIFSILQGERDELSVRAAEIETYDRPGGYTLLVNSAVCDQRRPFLLYEVLRRIMTTWVDRFPERYITRIYAQAMTKAGDMMAQHFFMSPRYDLANDAHMIDLARPARSKFIREYQEQIQRKAEQLQIAMPEELTRPYVPPPQPTVITPEVGTPDASAVTRPVSPAEAHRPISSEIRGAQSEHSRAGPTKPTSGTLPPPDLPPGTLSLQALADELSINRTTLLGHIVSSENKKQIGLVRNEKNDLEHMAVISEKNQEERKRYFTPEQADRVRDWHRANTKKPAQQRGLFDQGD